MGFEEAPVPVVHDGVGCIPVEGDRIRADQGTRKRNCRVGGKPSGDGCGSVRGEEYEDPVFAGYGLVPRCRDDSQVQIPEGNVLATGAVDVLLLKRILLQPFSPLKNQT
jgi:hypothetical protein